MTEVIEIGKEQAIALLERAVQEKGADYIYTPIRVPGMGEKCLYGTPDAAAPSCIVGHALAYVGVPVEKLVELDNLSELGAIYELNTTPIHEDYDEDTLTALTEIAGVHLTPEAEELFTEAQNNQDTGRTWGTSVQKAKDKLELNPVEFHTLYRDR